jgi:hypothetical protein
LATFGWIARLSPVTTDCQKYKAFS